MASVSSRASGVPTGTSARRTDARGGAGRDALDPDRAGREHRAEPDQPEARDEDGDDRETPGGEQPRASPDGGGPRREPRAGGGQPARRPAAPAVGRPAARAGCRGAGPVGSVGSSGRVRRSPGAGVAAAPARGRRAPGVRRSAAPPRRPASAEQAQHLRPDHRHVTGADGEDEVAGSDEPAATVGAACDQDGT